MLLDPHLVLPWRCKVERLRARQLDELTRAKWLGFNRGSRCLEMMPTKQWEDIPTTCKKWQDTDRCLWFQVPSPHLIVFFVIFLWGAALCMIEVCHDFKQAVARIPCIPDFKEGFSSRTFGPRLELNDEQMRAKDALKTEEELKSEVPVWMCLDVGGAFCLLCLRTRSI